MFNYAVKIQGLLATAESLSDTNPEAAANYRAKAEELMREYRIAEEEALAQDVAAVVPIKVEMLLAPVRGGLNRDWYRRIFSRIADHCGVRFVIDWRNGDMYASVVGYEGDVRYAQFLYTAAFLMFSTRIDPVWDHALPEAENIWRLRNAGIERRVIADSAWGSGAGREAKNRSKVQRVYLKECALRGEQARAAGLGHQTSVYRDAYAESFVTTLGTRLRMAREATDTVGGGLVLHGRSDRVDEAFYGHFPHRRPAPTDVTPAEPTPCGKCAKAKSGYCRDHRLMAWTAADERRWQARTNSPSARAGQESGRVAAEGVVIRGTEAASRLERGGHAIEA